MIARLVEISLVQRIYYGLGFPSFGGLYSFHLLDIIAYPDPLPADGGIDHPDTRVVGRRNRAPDYDSH